MDTQLSIIGVEVGASEPQEGSQPLEWILSRSMAPIFRALENKSPELALALVPSMVRTMLAAFLAGAIHEASEV